jgi:hypothetical protein
MVMLSELRSNSRTLDYLVWNSVYLPPKSQDIQKEELIRDLFGLFLLHSRIPITGPSHDLITRWVDSRTVGEERKRILREYFKGVDTINSDNVVMMRKGEYIFMVYGGSALVRESVSGEVNCKTKIDELIELFCHDLDSMPKPQ